MATWTINPKFKQSIYIGSSSCRVICDKGMLACSQLKEYCLVLAAEVFEAHVAIVHSRFPINKFPSWDRAHPYRYLCHNGEINTACGKSNWMYAWRPS